MTTFATALNEDVNSIITSAYYGDRGDGNNAWYHQVVTADGGDTTQGLKADAAVTNPASDGTVIALLKGILTANRLSPAGMLKAEDAAHASGDSGIMALGVRNDARATFATTDIDYSPFATGTAGNLMTSPVPTTLSGWSPSTYAALAAASGVIKASAGKLYKLNIYNNNGAARFFQLFNLTAVPADTTVPLWAMSIPTLGFVELDFTDFGRYFSTGICWCLSTTFATKTVAGADGAVLGEYI